MIDTRDRVCRTSDRRPASNGRSPTAVPYPRGARGHGGARRGHPRGPGARARLAAGAPAALHRRHLRASRRTCSRPTASRCSRRAAAASTPITGPGQRVAYAMLDLSRAARRARLRRRLEEWIIGALAAFDVRARSARAGSGSGSSARTARRTDRREDKIAAIGVRIRRWVSFHGIAMNVEPDLSTSPASCPAASAATG